MNKRKEIIYVADFETTIYQDQDFTEVWASALVPLYSEDVLIHHSIQETFDYLKSLNSHVVLYYHNLEFDGSFWLYFLREVLNFPVAFQQPGNEYTIDFLKDEEMINNSFKYLIDDMGKWYTVTIKVNDRFIVLKDSLKLLPFSVKKIGEAFQTKHRKLEMNYEGFRYAGCNITEEEKEYIRNDVLVVKEALEIMFEKGHNSLTIGSCALKEFKTICRDKSFHFKKSIYYTMFPDLSEIELPEGEYGAYNGETLNADEYIRRSYKGGWCYLNPKRSHKDIYNGCTYDVNSLYPFVMEQYSYPIGSPTFWKGKMPIDESNESFYFFVRFKCRFKLKKNHLPTVQIKRSVFYPSNEWLTTSNVRDKNGNYHEYITDVTGNVQLAQPVLTMTKTDFLLFKEHYDISDFEMLDGCYFQTERGIFKEYIEKYKEIKMNSTGAIRELAKLMLNSLYGKMSSSKNSSFKFAYEKEDGTFSFLTVPQFNKKCGYIAVGSAITSYARNHTIRAAQGNYDRFVYADTDSIHCIGNPEDIINIFKHNYVFGGWKLESEWDVGYYVRQKTYIELFKENYGSKYNIICAGMTEYCKNLLRRSLNGDTNVDDLEDEVEKEFVKEKRNITDFDYGLIVPGKLMKKQIKGGVVLVKSYYEMRGKC